jgi:hypothetical protein
MTFIKVLNGKVEKYPYTIKQLKADLKTVSFSSNPTEETLGKFGVFKVIETEKPLVTDAQIVKEGLPELVAGKWVQTWIVSDVSAEKLKQRRVNELKDFLSATDYKDLPSYKPKAGEAIEEVIAQRDVWREEIRRLESELVGA